MGDVLESEGHVVAVVVGSDEDGGDDCHHPDAHCVVVPCVELVPPPPHGATMVGW